MTNQPHILLPNGQPYDRSRAQDHTGLTFQSGPMRGTKSHRSPRHDPRNFMRSPAWLECPNCKSDGRFQILVEDHPMGDGMMQIYCSKCHDVWPVLQVSQPQMSNRIAHELGLSVPDPVIDMTVDLDEEE
jgi:hypothetical protein